MTIWPLQILLIAAIAAVFGVFSMLSDNAQRLDRVECVPDPKGGPPMCPRALTTDGSGRPVVTESVN